MGAIITCCKSDVMRKIGMRAMLQLHESEIIPALLYNSETWTLNQAEKKFLDQVELYAWKKMIGLPQSTPTAGVILSTGSLFTSIRVGTRQLMYLHKVLQKHNDHWARVTLKVLEEQNLGWAKQTNEILERW